MKWIRIYSRYIIKGVDYDQTQCNKKYYSGRDDVSWNQKTDPRHNYKNGCRQIDIEQIW